MDLPYNYVPPAAGIPTPTREEIIKGPFLTRRTLKLVKSIVNLKVLAAPEGILQKRGRWALPAGELYYAVDGLAFLTQGKRIGPVERYLGGTLFGVIKTVGVKFAEPVVGNAIGEELVSTIEGVHGWYERLESLGKYSEGMENSQSLFLPANRIVSLSLTFEPNNMYGVKQLDLVIENDAGAFTTYNFLAREEDAQIFDRHPLLGDQVPFIYFLRLNYEQRHFQTSLFQRYANASLEIPQKATDWSLPTLSFKPEFYERAAAALNPDAPTVDAIRLEALARSRDVISRLRIIDNKQYDIDVPSGKLFDLATP